MNLPRRVFDYQIEPADGGWRWVAFRADGGVADSGTAQSKSVAAAFIIRALTRDCILAQAA